MDPDGTIIFPPPVYSTVNGPARTVLNFTSIGKTMQVLYGNKVDLTIIEVSVLNRRRGSTSAIYADNTFTNLLEVGIKIKSFQGYYATALTIAHEFGHASVAFDVIAFDGAAGEIAAFTAQFSAASELYASSDMYSKQKWQAALFSTTPKELRSAYNLFDITKSYADQSREFYAALKTGAILYSKRVDAETF